MAKYAHATDDLEFSDVVINKEFNSEVDRG